MSTLWLDPAHDPLFLSPRRRAAPWQSLALLAITACGGDSGGPTSLGADTDDATESAGTLDETGTGEELDEPPTTWPDQIAFSTTIDGTERFGVIDVDSLEATLLSPPDQDCSFGDWSPDGRTMAYECEGSLYVGWGDGTHGEMIFEGDRVSRVHWSPLGDEIALYGTRPEPFDFEIWTVPLDGGPPLQVTSGVSDLKLFRWSHDGARIVMREEGPDPSTYVISAVDVGSGVETVLSSGEGNAIWEGLSVAQAGIARGFVAYSSAQDSERTRIWVMDLDGNRAADISGLSSRMAEHPEWSPQGTWIAWTELTGSDAFLVVAQPDGSERVSHPVQGIDPLTWSPDETRIASGFGIVDVETGETSVVSADFPLDGLRWRPHPAQ